MILFFIWVAHCAKNYNFSLTQTLSNQSNFYQFLKNLIISKFEKVTRLKRIASEKNWVNLTVWFVLHDSIFCLILEEWIEILLLLLLLLRLLIIPWCGLLLQQLIHGWFRIFSCLKRVGWMLLERVTNWKIDKNLIYPSLWLNCRKKCN